ncbi:unnamed protein product, partial [Symbiodinium necroappetens]
MSSASSTDEITRTREGVPVWDGDASTYTAYAEAAELYEQTTAYHKRSLVAPRLVAELQGAARKLVVGQPANWLSFNGGVAKLLEHLRVGLGQPKIPEFTEHLHRYFRQSRRRNGESINSYVSRKMEIYLRAQQAMKRLKPVHETETSRTASDGGRQHDWRPYYQGAPWWNGGGWNWSSWTGDRQNEARTTEEEPTEDQSTDTQSTRRESWQSEATWGDSDWSGERSWNHWTWQWQWGSWPQWETEPPTAREILPAEEKNDMEAALGTGIPTSMAMQQGKCVVDSGATKSIGSVTALEQLMQQNLQQAGKTGVEHVDVSDRPTFNFGNSSEDQCSSTVEMQLKAGGQDGRLRVHALNVGQGPILLSIAALRSLGAIIDFREDLMCMRELDPHRIIALERSSTGHQLIDLSKDLYQNATTVERAVPSLKSFVQESATLADECSLQVLFPQPHNMSGMTNQQLRAKIQQYGESPPSRWTKAELQRLEELSGQNAFVAAPKVRAEKSQYQQLVQDLNAAARKKDHLLVFCEKTLRLNVNRNMTIDQMRREAMFAIYQKSTPDPTDLVGFGKHASLTYEEIKAHHPDYARWVTTTANENAADSDPRLQRLAGWLENNPARVGHAATTMARRAEASQEVKVPPSEMVKGKSKKSSVASGCSDSEASASSSQVSMLASLVEQLREEVADLKKEPRRKKTTVENEDNKTEDSYAMISEKTAGM